MNRGMLFTHLGQVFWLCRYQPLSYRPYKLPLTKQTPFLSCDQHYTKQSIGLRRYLSKPERVLECAPCVNISMCPYIHPPGHGSTAVLGIYCEGFLFDPKSTQSWGKARHHSSRGPTSAAGMGRKECRGRRKEADFLKLRSLADALH